MSDNRHKKNKNVRWDDKERSGSSRASTTGGSSSTSSYSSTIYPQPYSDNRYNVGALQETLALTVKDLDSWTRKAEMAEAKLLKQQTEFQLERAESHKQQTESNARIAALEQANSVLQDDKKGLNEQLKQAKREIARLQQKLQRDDEHSEPSSPDAAASNHSNSGKPRKSESKRVKDKEKEKVDDSDKQSDRLKARQNKRCDDGSTPKPPSSSKPPHRARRMSTSSQAGEEKPYSDGWGPSTRPTVNTSMASLRPEHHYAEPFRGNYHMSPATMQSPIYPENTPRSSQGMVRPSIEYDVIRTAPIYHQDVNYQPYPMPPRM